MAVWRSEWCAQDGSPEGLRAALAFKPSDAAKWRRLGVLLLQKNPNASAAAFHRAIELNPYEADALVGLALHAEAEQDMAAAESFYIRATEASRRFRPRYALAAFYARRNRFPELWRTAAAAAAIDRADVGRIVRLARDAGADPDSIPSLLELRTEHALAAYLPIAIAENRLKPLAQIATLLPVTPEHRPALVHSCEHLIEAGEADAAVAVWNRLRVFEKLDATSGRSLTNGRFAYEKVRGFNWRHDPLAGVDLRPAPGGLRIELSGGQPEHAVLLEQIAPVLGGRAYRFTVQADIAQLAATAGLSWRIECAPSREALASAPLAATTSVPFSTLPTCTLARLMLEYNRQPGTVRIAGLLDLLAAKLELLP
ncbi:MAG TPA: hypothetical protein VFL57_21275 [Bryobacteraceae bacterium]|nr:hypothetical protein [Bryobacteraceae bacterium]